MGNFFLKKQISIALIICVLALDFGIMLAPQKASALVPLPAGVNISEPIPGVPVSDAALRNKEAGWTVFGVTIPGATWDALVVLAVRVALEKLSDSLVDWINEGPDEEGPLFATDPEQFFRDVADNVAGDFIDSIGLGALCSPFKLEVRAAVESVYNSSRTYSRDPYDAQCTLSGVVGNIEGFLSGDFDQGGWAGWYELTQRNQNNPYSAVLDAEANLSVRLAGERGVELLRLNWSDGFIGWSECIKWNEDGSCNDRGPTKTPGTVIEAQLNKTVSSEISQLELADEFDEIVAALAKRLGDLFMNRNGLITSEGNRRKTNPGDGTGVGGTLSGICTADRLEGIMGETEITWTAVIYAAGSNEVTYSWSGSGGLSGNTQTVKKIYTTPGQQTASVAVAFVNDAGETSNLNINCNDTVDIARFGPIKVDCSPVDPSAYFNPAGQSQSMFQQSWRQPVGWKAVIRGGSGNYSRIRWGGSFPTVRGGAIESFPQYDLDGPYADAVRFGWQVGDDEATAQWPRRIVNGNIQTDTPTQMVLVRVYDSTGNSNASLTVIDSDSTVKPVTVYCDPDILIYK